MNEIPTKDHPVVKAYLAERARIAGSIKSPAKAKASRENAKKKRPSMNQENSQ